MKREFNFNFMVIYIFISIGFLVVPVLSQKVEEDRDTDEKVRKFLESYRYKWGDMNIPESDGKVL